MSGETALILCLALPSAGALLIALTGRNPNLREAVTLSTAAALFLVVLSLYGDLRDGIRPAVTFFDVVPGLPLAFALEPLGMLFALVASGLWIVNSIYSIGYMRGNKEENQTRFYICFAIAIASSLGIALAENMFTLFIFYEVLTLSTYPLVTHKGTEDARRGGRTYLGILIGTSIGFQLVAIVWTWVLSGTLDFTAGGILRGKAEGPFVGILLALYVFGIGKAAVMPFHRWLPAAMVAPTPVSALLHAVAVVKAGVFTVMKVIVYIFGIDFLSQSGASEWLIWVAAFTILAASLVAMTKDNLKARLAYSTISQLSYVVLGAAMATSLGTMGGSMQIITHAFGKITLFFCAGAIYVAAHKTEISDMRGIGRTMPFTTIAFFLASLSIIGLPPFGGLWSKWYLGLGAIQADQMLLVAVLMISSLLNVVYLLALPIQGFFSAPLGTEENGGSRSVIKEAPLPCLLAIGASTLGTLLLFFFPEWLHDLLLPLIST